MDSIAGQYIVSTLLTMVSILSVGLFTALMLWKSSMDSSAKPK